MKRTYRKVLPMEIRRFAFASFSNPFKSVLKVPRPGVNFFPSKMYSRTSPS